MRVKRYELTGLTATTAESARTRRLGTCRATYERINDFKTQVFQQKTVICNKADLARGKIAALPSSAPQSFLATQQKDLLDTVQVEYMQLAQMLQNMANVIGKYRENNRLAGADFNRLNTTNPSTSYVNAAREHGTAGTAASTLHQELQTEFTATQLKINEVGGQRTQIQALNDGFDRPGSTISGLGTGPGNQNGAGSAIANALPWIQAGSMVGQLALAMNNVTKVPDPPKPKLAGSVAGTNLAGNQITATANSPSTNSPNAANPGGASRTERDSSVSNPNPVEYGATPFGGSGGSSTSNGGAKKMSEVKVARASSIGSSSTGGEPHAEEGGAIAPSAELGALGADLNSGSGAPKPTKISGSENDASIKNILKDMESNFALGTLQDPNLPLLPNLNGALESAGKFQLPASEFPAEMESGGNLMGAREENLAAVANINIFNRVHAYHIRCIKRGLVLKVPKSLPN